MGGSGSKETHRLQVRFIGCSEVPEQPFLEAAAFALDHLRARNHPARKMLMELSKNGVQLFDATTKHHVASFDLDQISFVSELPFDPRWPQHQNLVAFLTYTGRTLVNIVQCPDPGELISFFDAILQPTASEKKSKRKHRVAEGYITPMYGGGPSSGFSSSAPPMGSVYSGRSPAPGYPLSAGPVGGYPGQMMSSSMPVSMARSGSALYQQGPPGLGVMPQSQMQMPPEMGAFVQSYGGGGYGMPAVGSSVLRGSFSSGTPAPGAGGLPRPASFTQEQERIFRDFHSYDFDNDEVFLGGLAEIVDKYGLRKMNKKRREFEVLKVKAHYFSKYFQPVDLNSYFLWRVGNNAAGNKDNMINKAFGDGPANARKKPEQRAGPGSSKGGLGGSRPSPSASAPPSVSHSNAVVVSAPVLTPPAPPQNFYTSLHSHTPPPPVNASTGSYSAPPPPPPPSGPPPNNFAPPPPPPPMASFNPPPQRGPASGSGGPPPPPPPMASMADEPTDAPKSGFMAELMKKRAEMKNKLG